MQVKSPVTKGETDEFLRKMTSTLLRYETVNENSNPNLFVVFLIHSDEHHKVVMKNLKEVHFPTEVTVIQLENIARRIFEVNRTTFSNDELQVTGT